MDTNIDVIKLLLNSFNQYFIYYFYVCTYIDSSIPPPLDLYSIFQIIHRTDLFYMCKYLSTRPQLSVEALNIKTHLLDQVQVQHNDYISSFLYFANPSPHLAGKGFTGCTVLYLTLLLLQHRTTRESILYTCHHQYVLYLDQRF